MITKKPKLKTFVVPVVVTITGWYQLKAASLEEAKKLAVDREFAVEELNDICQDDEAQLEEIAEAGS